MTLRQTVSDVHRRVLSGFRYVSDIDQWGVEEHWHLPPDVDSVVGDCDDFAIACRHLLRESGVSSRLIVCRVPEGYHLVCAAGPWILCNRQSAPRQKTELMLHHGYRWMYASGFEPGEPWREVR